MKLETIREIKQLDKYHIVAQVENHFSRLGIQLESSDRMLMIRDGEFRAFLSKTPARNIQFYYRGRLSNYFNSNYDGLTLDKIVQMYEYYKEDLKDSEKSQTFYLDI